MSLTVYPTSFNCENYNEFETLFLEVLDVHAPLKKKIIRANEVSLRKSIATRSRSGNRYYRNKTDETRNAYKKQKHYCSNLYKKERKIYYANLDVRKITDNKRFWKTKKPLFSDKNLEKNSITLVLKIMIS